MEAGILLKTHRFEKQNIEGRHIAYLRVSTDKQDLDNQKLEVLSDATNEKQGARFFQNAFYLQCV